MRLKIASRKSDLARWQALRIGQVLSAAIGSEIEYLFKSSLGDLNLDVPLASMGSKGVFTDDFYADLIGGVCDAVVHSWKDLPVEEREDTHIAMTLPRADMRDVLLIPEKVWQAAERSGKLIVFTSSPRRVYNLGEYLARLLPGELKIDFQPVRGNVPTRLKKMHESGCGLVLAKAGLDRLLMGEREGMLSESVRDLVKDCRFVVLPVSLNPPAPAQGALAVEVARANVGLLTMCLQLNDRTTMECVRRERDVLSRYGGGCHQKIGVAVMARSYGTVFSLRGKTDSGEVLQDWRIENETPWTSARDASAVFPHQGKENSWFKRVAMKTSAAKDCPALLVARADAWPQGYKPTREQIVWCAGVQTWFKLAAQGIFVNGCQDGLGESEPAMLEELLDGPVTFTKFSHEGAPGENVIATYRLEPNAMVPNLNGMTHFFWMSATSFQQARELYPEIIANGWHACGPGHTYDFLKKQTDLRRAPKVFADLNQFLRETLP